MSETVPIWCPEIDALAIIALGWHERQDLAAAARTVVRMWPDGRIAQAVRAAMGPCNTKEGA